MTTTIYRVSYSYNAGLLGTHQYFNTEAEVNEFEKEYKTNFKDCCKGYTVDRITTKRVLGVKVKRTVETIREWWED